MSNDAIVKGINDVTRVSEPRSYSRQSGEVVGEVWAGPRVKVKDLYDTLKDDVGVDSLDYDPEGGVARLTVFRSDPDLDQDGKAEENAIWEIAGAEIFRDLRTHPYITLRSGAILEEILIADTQIAKGEAYDAALYSLNNVIKRYFALRLVGVQGYYQSTLVLRKTITVSARSDLQAEYDGANRVQTIAQINPPDVLLGPLTLLPVITGYDNFNLPASPTIEDGTWEWLKKTPKVRAVEGAKQFDLVLEWWGAEAWSAIFYGGSYDPQM